MIFKKLSIIQKYFNLTDLIVILLSLIISIYYQYPALSNEYVFNGDVRQIIYWMRQFYDQQLFRNDLLTDFAKNYVTWGWITIYYFASFFVDPVIFSKILPIILFAITSFYLFRFLLLTFPSYIGFIGVYIFMVMSPFMNWFTGGFPHSFGFPLLIIFMYYFTKKKYRASALTLIIQSLIYPFVFFISFITYLLSFISIRKKRLRFDITKQKFIPIILSFIFCGICLIGQFIISLNPSIGNPVTRQEMLGRQEFTYQGRYQILPSEPVIEALVNQDRFSRLILDTLSDYAPFLNRYLSNYFYYLLLFILFTFAIILSEKRRNTFPTEVICLLFSSVIMYIIADIFLVRFYLPIRYFQFSIPIISLVFYLFILNQLIFLIRNMSYRKTIIMIIGMMLFIQAFSLKSQFIDVSYHKKMFQFLKTLPKNSMIAAHPEFADNIPTFSMRKVFINYELSQPIYNKYWNTVKSRIDDFFNAYYSDNLKEISSFMQANNIDYFVIQRYHFESDYLNNHNFYFEPFNSYISQKVIPTKEFVFKNLSENEVLYKNNFTYIVEKKTLESLANK